MNGDLMIARDFSVGVLHGWHGVLYGLIASFLFMVCGRQDLRSRATLAPIFWFSLALTSTAGVVWLGFGARIFGGALLGAVVLCSEVWLIRRWWQRGYFKQELQN